MLTDKKLQVYFPKGLYHSLRRRAQDDGKTVAELVRESVAAYLDRSPAERARGLYAKLDALVGTLRDDGAGAAESHDEALGARSRW